MESQQKLFRGVFLHHKNTISFQKRIVDLTMDIVDCIFSVHNGSRNGNISAYRFMETLIKFMQALAKEEHHERLCIPANRWTSGKQPMDEIERLGQKLTEAVYILGNDIKSYSIDGVINYQQQVIELQRNICTLKSMAKIGRTEEFTYIQETFEHIHMEIEQIWKDVQADNEKGVKLSENEDKNQENRANTKRPEEVANLLQTPIPKQTQLGMAKSTEANSYEDEKVFENDNKQQEKDTNETKRNAKLVHFRKKLDKFRKSLNEDEIEDTISFVKTTKSTWEKQMAEVSQLEYELTTEYFLGKDIDKDFEDIEILYGSKLKQLNRRINVLKAEETETLKKLLTEMQQVTQITTKTAITEDKNQEKKVIGNIQFERFKSKLAILQSNISDCDLIRDNLYCCESTKASLEKQMYQIEQLEHELATVYLLGDDICSELEIIKIDYYRRLRSLNKRIGDLRK